MKMQHEFWTSLSDCAIEMLQAYNSHSPAITPPEIAREFLQNHGCPAFPLFEKYISSFGGLRIAFSKSTIRVNCKFLGVKSGLQCVRNAENQWRLLISEPDETHQGMWLRPDGSIYIAYYSGQQFQQTISGSCETMLEHYGMLWRHSSEEYIIDSVSSSLCNGAKTVAELMELPEVPEASDQYIHWWSSPRIAIGSIPLIGRRFRVYAS
jgi:hypothetical protein